MSKVQEAGVVDAAKDAYFKVSNVAVTAAVSVKERLETAAQGPPKPLANFPKGKIAATGFGSDSYSSQPLANNSEIRGNAGDPQGDELASGASASRKGTSASTRIGNSSGAASASARVQSYQCFCIAAF